MTRPEHIQEKLNKLFNERAKSDTTLERCGYINGQIDALKEAFPLPEVPEPEKKTYQDLFKPIGGPLVMDAGENLRDSVFELHGKLWEQGIKPKAILLNREVRKGLFPFARTVSGTGSLTSEFGTLSLFIRQDISDSQLVLVDASGNELGLLQNINVPAKHEWKEEPLTPGAPIILPTKEDTKVLITYFKATGKYYSEEELILPEVKDDYMTPSLVRSLMEQGLFPGLRGDSWEGFAVVRVNPDGVPRLIDCKEVQA